mmetsp:Transcript_26469/g.84195  ORF Transcript_26469/g.84195 Transcript_26469/m.84195 type:complete len:233 (-) Transcript_26469:1578-2276(-)
MTTYEGTPGVYFGSQGERGTHNDYAREQAPHWPLVTVLVRSFGAQPIRLGGACSHRHVAVAITSKPFQRLHGPVRAGVCAPWRLHAGQALGHHEPNIGYRVAGKVNEPVLHARRELACPHGIIRELKTYFHKLLALEVVVGRRQVKDVGLEDRERAWTGLLPQSSQARPYHRLAGGAHGMDIVPQKAPSKRDDRRDRPIQREEEHKVLELAGESFATAPGLGWRGEHWARGR